jgi:hypothetical protein
MKNNSLIVNTAFLHGLLHWIHLIFWNNLRVVNVLISEFKCKETLNKKGKVIYKLPLKILSNKFLGLLVFFPRRKINSGNRRAQATNFGIPRKKGMWWVRSRTCKTSLDYHSHIWENYPIFWGIWSLWEKNQPNKWSVYQRLMAQMVERLLCTRRTQVQIPALAPYETL